ncbi:uncharacterized protein TNCV_614201 [Trichonephila clavipes]|nr:uncharacterized protein TNCV_614201 [Trichonephila clavipes]
MQDGAPQHITRCVTDVLKHHFTEERVISRQFRHLWPPRSPDLNPCDFWLRGHLKQLSGKNNCKTWRVVVITVANQRGSRPTWGFDGNEKADFLLRTAAEKWASPTGSLTLSELNQLGITPSSHPWYFGRNLGGSLRLMPRNYQTAFWHFVSSHINDLTFRQGQNIFLESHCCYSELVSPASILACFGFKKERGPSGPSAVFRISGIFFIFGDCLALLDNLGLYI